MNGNEFDALRPRLRVSAAHRLPRYESLRPLYNLCDLAAYEAELEPVCLRHGLGVISVPGLAAGFLTGKYRNAAAARVAACCELGRTGQRLRHGAPARARRVPRRRRQRKARVKLRKPR